ncbi:MAG: Clp protease N-terminal domain-containing protein, partial [Nevskiaceae bacterium]
MRHDKLTTRFQQALADAQSLAVGRDHPHIEPVHLMWALLNQEGGSTQPLLLAAGVNADQLRNRLAQLLDRLPALGQASGEVQI